MRQNKSLKFIHRIISRNSVTFSNSTLFFPQEIKYDVRTLYAFVRTADDFVDSIPQDPNGFFKFRDLCTLAKSGKSVDDPIIQGFYELSARKHFNNDWISAFLDAMECDLSKNRYETIEETLHYIYGSAEVVGLMMASILGLPKESYKYAQMMGRAFQYINFIRDIKEDSDMGRIYLPAKEAESYGLDLLNLNGLANKVSFNNFIRNQIERYKFWKNEASIGYEYIPLNSLTAIKTAADIFDWTARMIEMNPSIVIKKKVKPQKLKVITLALLNRLSLSSKVLR